MKKFIKKSLLFLLVLFAASFIIQQVIFFAMKQIDKGELSIMNKVVNGEINAEILICGSSRAYVNFDPEVIEKATGLKAFNLGLNGSRLSIQLPVLKTYLKYNKKPKIIIQEVGLESLAPDAEVYAPYRYLPYLHEDELYEGLEKIDKNLWIHKYIPLANFYYFNPTYQKIFFKDIYLSIFNKKDYLIEGYHPNPNTWSIQGKEFLKENEEGIYAAIVEESVNDLKEIVEICKDKNIKIILVNAPEYYKILPLQYKRNEIVETYKEIADKYGIRYLDFSKSEMSKEKKYFYNFTHLNNRGAGEFSSYLSERLNYIYF